MPDVDAVARASQSRTGRGWPRVRPAASSADAIVVAVGGIGVRGIAVSVVDAAGAAPPPR